MAKRNHGKRDVVDEILSPDVREYIGYELQDDAEKLYRKRLHTAIDVESAKAIQTNAKTRMRQAAAIRQNSMARDQVFKEAEKLGANKAKLESAKKQALMADLKELGLPVDLW